MERVLVPRKKKRTVLGHVSGRVVLVHPDELSLGNGPVNGDFILVIEFNYYVQVTII